MTSATATGKRRAAVALSLCGLAVVAIVALTVVLSNNVVYFRSVSEAVASRQSDGDRRFRIAGEVVAGSVRETAQGVNFRVSDGRATVTIVHRGESPSLFKEGAPVVAEGRWSGATTFASDRIMIRHGNEYTPPKVNDREARAGTAKAAEPA